MPTGSPLLFEADGALDVDDDPETGGLGGFIRFRGSGALEVRTNVRGDAYRLVVVNHAGDRITELDKASIGNPSWEHNGPGVLDWSMSARDPKHAACLPFQHEVQLWKGQSMIWSGPIVAPLGNPNGRGYQAAEPLWYFTRRFFGKADRTNYLPNGDFEAGLAHWNFNIASPLEPASGRSSSHWNVRRSGIRAMTGRFSLRMEQETAGVPKYGFSAGQVFEWTIDPEDAGPEGSVWTITAYAYIPSADWRDPALHRIGLSVGRFSTTETVDLAPEDGSGSPVSFPAPLEVATSAMDDYTPQDQWVRMSASVQQPPLGDTELIVVGLFCPDGVVFWDRVSLTLDEATRFSRVDQADILAGIVAHLQDPAYGKSDLGITSRTSPTGVLRDRTYYHAEHGNGFDALAEFPTLDDGVDFSVETTPTSRVFTTHYPERGHDRSRSVVLEYGRNVETYTYGWDGTRAASLVITLGSGDGSGREEGFARDTALFGGVTMEEVYVAPEGSDISTLDNRAAERLNLVRDPEILELTTNENAIPLIGVLGVGDRVYVRVKDGPLDIDGVRRIVRMVLDTKTDVLTITTNRVLS